MKTTRIVPCVPVLLSLVLFLSPAAKSSAQNGSEYVNLSQTGAWTAAEMDWPYWRGPEFNGISREKGIVERWEPHIKDAEGKIVREGENVLWQRDDLGGRSTPVVMNGKLYMLVRDQPGTPLEGEKVVCLDAATGETLWENSFNVYLSDVPDTRVGWSSVFADPVPDPDTGIRRVFALGVCGFFQCLNADTGETLWSHSMHEEYGLLSTYGGRTNFPIVHGDLVIISAIVIGWGDMAKPAHRFIAFDKRNGQPVWFEGTRLLPYDTTYSSPVLAVLDGQTQLIFGSGDGGVHGFQPQTGRALWNYQVSPKRGLNIAPVVSDEGLVVYGHSEENVGDTTMGALLAVDAAEAAKKGGQVSHLWRHNQWYVGKSSPIIVDGRIYAAEDGGTLLIVDLKTGELISDFRLRGKVFASPLYADGKIFLCTESGIWWTLKPTEEGVEELYRARLRGVDMYGSPIISHGRMYVPSTTALYCIGKPDHQPSADPRPPVPQEAPVSGDPEPAHAQLVPVESLLRPGQKQQFQVRLYNSRGQYLKTADAKDVEFAVEGAGSIDESGKYTTPEEGHSGVHVSATVAGLTGRARLRVIPDLPWSFDFDNGNIPVTWVGIRYRHIPLDFDLFKKLEKADRLTAQLYIYLTTDFTNGQPRKPVGVPLRYDEAAPAKSLAEMLYFLEQVRLVNADIPSVEFARKILEGPLETLKEEKVVSRWEWTEDEDGVVLVVERGEKRVDGNGVIAKISTIPKGTRSQGWIGHPDFANYTVQADVLAGKRVFEVTRGGEQVQQNKMGDIGLIAQRYAFVLKGASQEMEIRTWHAQLRMASTEAFQWKPDTWYTMKLQASSAGGKAVLRGKVWPRDEAEPGEWMIEATDESPNTVGSPGFFGDATLAEIFYDNLEVTRN